MTMRHFKDLSIKLKLMLIIMITSGLSLVLASVAFMAYDLLTYREQIAESVRGTAQSIAFSSTAALKFDDPKVATQALAVVSLRPRVLAAGIYTKDGRLFATYSRPGQPEQFPEKPGRDGRYFSGDYLILFEPIILENERVGTVYILRDMGDLYDRPKLYAGIALAILIGSSLAAFALSAVLQRIISQPILNLAGVARLVSGKKDYSIRAVRTSHDELGVLIDGFNEMLEQIQQRDLALGAREAVLRQFVEHTPAAIAMLDNNMRYIVVSKRWLADYRLGDRDLVGLSHYEVFPEVPEHWKVIHRRCLAGAVERRDEDPFPRADGILDWVRWEVRPWLTAEKKIGGVIIFSELITERKRAEDALRESRQRLAMMVQNTPLGVTVWSPERKFLEWNKSAERIFGYAEAEAVNQDIHLIIPESAREFVDKIVEQLLAQSGGTRATNENITKDGRILICDWYNTPLVNAEGKVFAVASLVEDITERVRSEEEIRKLNMELEKRVQDRTRQLEAANKELEAFSYSVSHDLRAPLRAIDGFSRIIVESYSDKLDETGKDYLQRVCDATQRMGMLIDDLLTLSRVSRADLKRVEVNLSEIAESVLAELKAREPQREVDTIVSPGVIVQGDGRLLRIVMENLLGNAWKYTSKRQKALIEFGVTQSDGKMACFIRDNGAGFDMAYVGRLFGAFQRLHTASEFPGTGIGLATVQRIIHRHGGCVWGQGVVDKGATFYFSL